MKPKTFSLDKKGWILFPGTFMIKHGLTKMGFVKATFDQVENSLKLCFRGCDDGDGNNFKLSDAKPGRSFRQVYIRSLLRSNGILIPSPTIYLQYQKIKGELNSFTVPFPIHYTSRVIMTAIIDLIEGRWGMGGTKPLLPSKNELLTKLDQENGPVSETDIKVALSLIKEVLS